MRGFFARANAALERWMYGRYGADELSKFLTWTSMALLLLSCIRVLWWVYFLALALIIWSVVRTFSRNIPRRHRERAAYLRMTAKPRAAWALQRNKHRDRKTHCYFKCKQCRAVLRVPKHKGTIDVTCPRCHRVTVKKT